MPQLREYSSWFKIQDLVILLADTALVTTAGQEGFSIRSRPQAFRWVKNKAPFNFRRAAGSLTQAWPHIQARGQDCMGKLPTWVPRKPGQARGESTNIDCRWRCARWLSVEFWATESIVETDSANTWEHVLLPSPQRWMTSETSGLWAERLAGSLQANAENGKPSTLLAH